MISRFHDTKLEPSIRSFFKYKKQIILSGKIKKYYKNLLDDKFMRNQYDDYYQNALKWSKESLLQN